MPFRCVAYSVEAAFKKDPPEEEFGTSEEVGVPYLCVCVYVCVSGNAGACACECVRVSVGVGVRECM